MPKRTRYELAARDPRVARLVRMVDEGRIPFPCKGCGAMFVNRGEKARDYCYECNDGKKQRTGYWRVYAARKRRKAVPELRGGGSEGEARGSAE